MGFNNLGKYVSGKSSNSLDDLILQLLDHHDGDEGLSTPGSEIDDRVGGQGLVEKVNLEKEPSIKEGW